jgi:hypothetical protein
MFAAPAASALALFITRAIRLIAMKFPSARYGRSLPADVPATDE